jgi:hypothetical protein
VIAEIQSNLENATGAHGTSLIRKKEKQKVGLLDVDDSAEVNSSIQITAQTFLDENGKVPEFKITIESSSSISSSNGASFGDGALFSSAAVYTKGRDTSYPEFLVDSRVVGAQEIKQAAQTLQEKRKVDNVVADSAEEQWKKKARVESNSDGSSIFSATVAVSVINAATAAAAPSSTVQKDGIDDDMDDENIEWEEDEDKED